MAFFDNPEAALEEIAAAESLRDQHLSSRQDIISGFYGSGYLGKNDNPSPENHAYEYVMLMLPSIVYDNPRVSVESGGRMSLDGPALYLKHALNKWAKDVSLWRTLVLNATDFFFTWSIAMVRLEQLPGRPGINGLSPYRPVVDYLPPERFIIDNKAPHFRLARYMGHQAKRDQSDLLDDKRFNSEAVEDLAVDAGMEPFYSTDNMRDKGPKRKEVTLYEIWVPEDTTSDYSSKDGFNGSIYTLGTMSNSNTNKKSARWLRDPRPFFGPRWGPYLRFGMLDVPGHLHSLGPLTAVSDQIKSLNAHATSNATTAANQKKGIAYDPANPEAGRAAKNFKNGEVFALPGLVSGSVQELELGAVSPESWLAEDRQRDRLQRVSGIAAANTNPQKGITATADTIAAEAREERTSWGKRQYAETVKQVLETAAWYMWHSVHVVFPLGNEASEELEVMDPDFVGGMGPQMGLNFDDLQFEIEPHSMERVSEPLAQKRAQDTLDLVTRLAPQVIEAPFIMWDKLLEDVGQALNRKGLGDYIDMDQARAMSGQMMAAEGGGAGGGPGIPGRPRESVGVPGQVPGAAMQNMGELQGEIERSITL